MLSRSVRRRLRRVHHRVRLARVVARALASADHPILVQLVPIRRCNLSCAYCNEYDKTSPPVPTEIVRRRIDRLAELGASIVDLSGGEPLLHPDSELLVAHIRRRGMLAGILTNGYLLSRDRIHRLNDAGLDHLQLSIDNVVPDEVSHKSLKVLDQKLRWLAEEAAFDVHINAVLGGSTRPADALAVARRARELGFTVSVGLVHAAGGALKPLGPEAREVFREISRLDTSFYSLAPLNLFQRPLVEGRTNLWHCPAGGRYLYVCENGLVHWCSQQRGRPGTALEHYSRADLVRQRDIVKACAPACTISCVHRVAMLDELRRRPTEVLTQFAVLARAQGRALPWSARLIQWLFVTGPWRRPLGRAVRRIVGAQA